MYPNASRRSLPARLHDSRADRRRRTAVRLRRRRRRPPRGCPRPPRDSSRPTHRPHAGHHRGRLPPCDSPRCRTRDPLPRRHRGWSIQRRTRGGRGLAPDRRTRRALPRPATGHGRCVCRHRGRALGHHRDRDCRPPSLHGRSPCSRPSLHAPPVKGTSPAQWSSSSRNPLLANHRGHPGERFGEENPRATHTARSGSIGSFRRIPAAHPPRMRRTRSSPRFGGSMRHTLLRPRRRREPQRRRDPSCGDRQVMSTVMKETHHVHG